MARIHRGKGEAWLRGGQTFSHNIDMVMEVLGKLVILSLVWGMVCFWMGNRSSSELEQEYGIQLLKRVDEEELEAEFRDEAKVYSPYDTPDPKEGKPADPDEDVDEAHEGTRRVEHPEEAKAGKPEEPDARGPDPTPAPSSAASASGAGAGPAGAGAAGAGAAGAQ